MTMPQDGTVSDCALAVQIDGLHRKLKQLAEEGRWSEFSVTIKSRDELIAQAPSADRAAILKESIRANGQILQLAESARQTVANRLSSLRRSRDATASYDSHRDKNTMD